MDTDNPPSPLRLPLTAILIFTAPPLALVSWIMLSGGKRALYFSSSWIRAGAVTFAIGALPLLLISVLAAVRLWPDPNPNPIGLGLFFLAATVMACLFTLVGIIRIDVMRS